MSRIGRMPISLPSNVEVTLGEGNLVTVKGPKGTLTQKLSDKMTITKEENVIHVTRPNDAKENRALHGLTRTLLNNMVIGVTEGYKKELDVNGVGYRVAKEGKKLNMNIGYSHPVIVEEIDGITIDVPSPNKIVNDLGVDVGSAAEHVQTGSLGCAGDFAANASMTLLTLSVSIGSLNHLGTPLSYFFTPVLPSLRRMTSSVYLIPLPL